VGGRECVSRARPRPLSRPSFESDRTVRRRLVDVPREVVSG
jgi:hypothetical protein